MRRRRRKLLFVTGGRGFIGRHLVNGPATQKWEIVAPSSTSLDVRNRDRTISTIADWRPEAVIHLAYDKSDPRTIIDGSRHVAEGAARAGARLVHMSTDMVFAGQLAKYNEQEPPRPLVDYGRQKLAAEQLVAAVDPTAVIVRTSLVIGTDRLAPVQRDVQYALSTGGPSRPMAFFTDEVRCPAHADDIARAVVTLATQRTITGPLHVAGPEPVSRFELAQLTAEYLRMDTSRLLATTHAAEGVERPQRLVLDTALAARHGITCRAVSDVLDRQRMLPGPDITPRTASRRG